MLNKEIKSVSSSESLNLYTANGHKVTDIRHIQMNIVCLLQLILISLEVSSSKLSYSETIVASELGINLWAAVAQPETCVDILVAVN